MQSLQLNKIFKAATVNLVAKMVGGVVGLLQIILIARYFGISAQTDAYMIALWIPLFFWSMGETLLIYSFVPHLVAIQEKDGTNREMEVVNRHP